MIAAIAILMPAILHAQQGTPEATAHLPGISWEGPPGQVEWEPVDQGGSTDGGAQDHATARERHDEATERRQEQDLMAQQAMAEQAKRVANFMFWQTFLQIVVGVALLIGLGITIYYARQIAGGFKLSRQAPLTDHDTESQPRSVQIQPAAGAHIKGNIKF